MFTTPNCHAVPPFSLTLSKVQKSYYAGDDEEELFDKAVVFLQMVRTKLLILDELTQLKTVELRRKVLELSNETNVCILGSAVDPEKFIVGDLEIAGRFNDILSLDPYKEDDLSVFLGLIDLLLPFPSSSDLHIQQLISDKGEKLEGPCSFIYRVTEGILRDVMRLIYDASLLALAPKESAKAITIEQLHQAWNSIQHRRLATLHDEIAKSYKEE